MSIERTILYNYLRTTKRTWTRMKMVQVHLSHCHPNHHEAHPEIEVPARGQVADREIQSIMVLDLTRDSQAIIGDITLIAGITNIKIREEPVDRATEAEVETEAKTRNVGIVIGGTTMNPSILCRREKS